MTKNLELVIQSYFPFKDFRAGGNDKHLPTVLLEMTNILTTEHNRQSVMEQISCTSDISYMNSKCHGNLHIRISHLCEWNYSSDCSTKTQAKKKFWILLSFCDRRQELDLKNPKQCPSLELTPCPGIFSKPYELYELSTSKLPSFTLTWLWQLFAPGLLSAAFESSNYNKSHTSKIKREREKEKREINVEARVRPRGWRSDQMLLTPSQFY